MMRPNFTQWIAALHLGVYLLVSNAIAQEKPFRPEAGKFPPLEKAHPYRGGCMNLSLNITELP